MALKLMIQSFRPREHFAFGRRGFGVFERVGHVDQYRRLFRGAAERCFPFRKRLREEP